MFHPIRNPARMTADDLLSSDPHSQRAIGKKIADVQMDDLTEMMHEDS